MCHVSSVVYSLLLASFYYFSSSFSSIQILQNTDLICTSFMYHRMVFVSAWMCRILHKWFPQMSLKSKQRIKHKRKKKQRIASTIFHLHVPHIIHSKWTTFCYFYSDLIFKRFVSYLRIFTQYLAQYWRNKLLSSISNNSFFSCTANSFFSNLLHRNSLFYWFEWYSTLSISICDCLNRLCKINTQTRFFQLYFHHFFAIFVPIELHK